jgi:hypothetical protein
MTIARCLYEGLEIIPVDAHNTESAVSLLHRFFQEEGFSGDRSIITANLDQMRGDDNHWAALALNEGHFVGIVTVTSMIYIEWGRLGEIGDLYGRRRAATVSPAVSSKRRLIGAVRGDAARLKLSRRRWERQRTD